MTSGDREGGAKRSFAALSACCGYRPEYAPELDPRTVRRGRIVLGLLLLGAVAAALVAVLT